MAKKLVVILFAFAMLVCGQIQNLTIDEAIWESIKNLSEKLDTGTNVVVLNIESESKNLPDYIIDEMTMQIIKEKKLQLVDKSELSNILHEKNITNLNEIDETLSLELGKTLGATVIISGNISKLGEIYKLRTQARNTENGNIIGALSLNVKEDELLTDLLKADAEYEIKNPPSIDTIVPVVPEPAPAPVPVPAEKDTQTVFVNDSTVLILIKEGTTIISAEQFVTPSSNTQPTAAAQTDEPKREKRKRLTWLSTNFQRFNTAFPAVDGYVYGYGYNDDERVIRERVKLSAASLNLEAGFTRENSSFTLLGLLDLGRITDAFNGFRDYNTAESGVFGGGIYLGRTTYKKPVSDYFRFSGGWDIGMWVLNFTPEDDESVEDDETNWEGIQRSSVLLGGPHLKFLVGYKKVFLHGSFKTYFGMRIDHEQHNRYDDDLDDYYFDTDDVEGNNSYNGGNSFVAIFNWNIGITVLFSR